MSNEIMSHLNSIERQIMFALAWRSDSPIYAAIERNGGHVPATAETLPGCVLVVLLWTPPALAHPCALDLTTVSRPLLEQAQVAR